MEYLIETYTNEGGIVLDNTAASSFAVAAINTGRCFIGIEKKESYHAIAQQQVSEALTLNPSWVAKTKPKR